MSMPRLSEDNQKDFGTDWVLDSRAFRNFQKLYEGGKGYTLHVYTADDRGRYTQHFHTRLLNLMVLNLLYDVDKSYVDAGMPRKSYSSYGILTGSRLHSGIVVRSLVPD
jgi:hypothetical protein